jgi:hypothetical protein
VNAKRLDLLHELVCWDLTGLSRFEELSGRQAARTAILYAFDLIEHDGEDLRDSAFLERKDALAACCAMPRLASCLTNTLPKMGLRCSPMRAGSVPRASCRSGSTAPIGPPCRVWITVHNPASIAVQRERSEIWNR